MEDNLQDLLKGLCPSCYRSLQECRCNELKTDAKREKRKMEEESRRIALEALEQRYCMNCFHLKEECICAVAGIKPLSVRSEREQPLPIVGVMDECELDEPRHQRQGGWLHAGRGGL